MPSITETVALIYRDLMTITRALGGPMVVAVAVIAATRIGPEAAAAASVRPNAAILMGFVIGLVQVFLLTPYLIAVQRFVLLGERTTTYRLALREPRFQLFFTTWAAFSVLAAAPLFVLQASPPGGIVILVAIWYLAVMVFGLRLVVLFPAIAVDAPYASLAQALADTKGQAWRIFAVGIGAVLPVMMVGTFIGYAVQQLVGGNIVAGLIRGVAYAAVGAVEMTLFMVIAARFYQWLGQRPKQPE